MAERVLEWLENPVAYSAIQDQLTALRQRVAVPGACERAVVAIEPLLERFTRSRRAG
jgi:hypothetical protein